MNREKSFYENFKLESIDKGTLLKDEDLAHGLAIWNKDFAMSDFAQDEEILGLNGGAVIRELCFDWENGWALTEAAQKLEILKMLGDGGVAIMLASFSRNNGWGETSAAQKLEVLKLRNGQVALGLAINSAKNGWGNTDAAQNLEVLSLKDGEVACNLAEHSDVNGWEGTPAAQKEEVLKLAEGKVADLLEIVTFGKDRGVGVNI